MRGYFLDYQVNNVDDLPDGAYVQNCISVEQNAVLVKTRCDGEDYWMPIDKTVFEILEELHRFHSAHDIKPNMLVRNYIVESFSCDHREWQAVCAFGAITSRNSGELYSLIFEDAKHQDISDRLLKQGICWSVVESRIKVCPALPTRLHYGKLSSTQHVLFVAWTFGSQEKLR
jgi:hypothetical protein